MVNPKIVQITPAAGPDDMRVLTDTGEMWRRYLQANNMTWVKIEGPYPEEVPPNGGMTDSGSGGMTDTGTGL